MPPFAMSVWNNVGGWAGNERSSYSKTASGKQRHYVWVTHPSLPRQTRRPLTSSVPLIFGSGVQFPTVKGEVHCKIDVEKTNLFCYHWIEHPYESIRIQNPSSVPASWSELYEIKINMG